MPRLEPGMARIRVKDLRLRTFIGIKEEEILNKQDVLINLTILYPAADAVEVNDIEHALNYRTITKGDHPPRRGEPLRPARTDDPGNPRPGDGEPGGALRRGGSGQAARAALRRVGLDHPRRPSLRRPTSEPREDAHKRCPPAAPTLIIAGPGPVPSPCPEPSSRNTAMTAANLTEQQRTGTRSRRLPHPGPSFADPQGRQNIDLMNLAGFCRNCLSKWYKAAADDLGVEVSNRPGPRRDLRHALCRVESQVPERSEPGTTGRLRQEPGQRLRPPGPLANPAPDTMSLFR